MLRTSFPRSAALRPLGAAFSTSASAMAQGDTGAPSKTGGQGDAFQRRERASEDMAIRQRELEKLAALKKNIAAKQSELNDLQAHVDQVEKSVIGKDADAKKD